MIVRPEPLSISEFLKRLQKKFNISEDLTKISDLVIVFTENHLRIFEQYGKDDFYITNGDSGAPDYVFSYLTTFTCFRKFLSQHGFSIYRIDAYYEVEIKEGTMSIFTETSGGAGLLGVHIEDETSEDRYLSGVKTISLDVCSLYELTLDWQKWTICK